MITIIDGTSLNKNHIKLECLFSVNRVLSSRGFEVTVEGSGLDTLLEKSDWLTVEADLTFEIFNNESMRRELLSYVEGVGSVVSSGVQRLISNNDFKSDRERFSKSYEWYVGELLVRNFKAFSSSYGVKVSNICRNSDNGTSGDFDVLSILGDMSLLYLECKSGTTSQKSIKNTLERSISLHCVASIFFRQNINENSLRQQLNFDHPIFGHGGDIYKLNIKGVQDSTVYKWFDCYFIDASESQGNIENKLRCVLRIIGARRSMINMSIDLSDGHYGAMGYELIKINRMLA